MLSPMPSVQKYVSFILAQLTEFSDIKLIITPSINEPKPPFLALVGITIHIYIFVKICDFIMLLIVTALLQVEILSGGESEGGSLEEHVGQETQVPQSIANPHGDDKSVVRHLCQIVKRQLVWDQG